MHRAAQSAYIESEKYIKNIKQIVKLLSEKYRITKTVLLIFLLLSWLNLILQGIITLNGVSGVIMLYSNSNLK